MIHSLVLSLLHFMKGDVLTCCNKLLSYRNVVSKKRIPRVAVIGTGVIGLPVAVMLTQNKFRPNVTLIAAEFSPNITAYAAGASLHV